MIETLYRLMINKVLERIRNRPDFGILVGETSDITNNEQMSVRIRIIPNDFVPIEVFLGFIQVVKTSGEALYGAVKNALTSVNLSLAYCRSQGFDGAGNMRGKFKGLATLITRDFPLVIYSYCVGHCINLILQDACKPTFAQQGIDIVKSIKYYVKDSPKREAQFASFCQCEEIDNSILRHLCMTRWVFRKESLDKFPQNYEGLLAWIASRATERDETNKDRSNSVTFLAMLSKFSTYFAVRMIQNLFHLVQFTHCALQNPSLSITEVSAKMNLLSTLTAA